jgi:hypothetical protein
LVSSFDRLGRGRAGCQRTAEGSEVGSGGCRAKRVYEVQRSEWMEGGCGKAERAGEWGSVTPEHRGGVYSWSRKKMIDLYESL